MRVFGYSRVSTSDQANDGVSLDVQRQQIAGYAMMKGWAVDAMFTEEGVSGSIPLAEREQGRAMIAAVTKGDVIICAKLDRAFRSAADALAVMEDFKDEGIGLHLIDLGGDVTGNGVSKLVFTILAAVAADERDRLRTRIREARRYMASQGLHSGGKRPFGFDIVPDGKLRRLVPNPDESAVIERMKAMRRDGVTYRAIASATGRPHKSVQRILERTSR